MLPTWNVFSNTIFRIKQYSKKITKQTKLMNTTNGLNLSKINKTLISKLKHKILKLKKTPELSNTDSWIQSD
jgi:selenocysteine-specific translation elongation factor